MAVIIETVGTGTQCGVDVSEGHSSGYPLLSRGGTVDIPHLSGLVPCQGDGGGRVVLLEGVYTVVAIRWVLSGEEEECL